MRQTKYITTNLRPGRPKNATRFSTLSLRQAFIQVFNDLGGAEGMTEWILEKPNTRKKFFYGWITRMLPRVVDVEAESPFGELLEKWKDIGNDDLISEAQKLANNVLSLSRNS